MTRTKKCTLINWSIFATLFLLFSWWNGAFEGPLKPAEIDFFVKKIRELHPEKDTTNIRQMLQQDDGNPIFMMNAIKMRDKPTLDNEENQGKSSEEVLNRYNSFVLTHLLKRGSYPVYVGIASGKTAASWGVTEAEDWTSGAVMRYKNLRTLLEMGTSPEFRAVFRHKVAAIEKTIAYPTKVSIQLGSLQVVVFFMLLSAGLGGQLLILTQVEKV